MANVVSQGTSARLTELQPNPVETELTDVITTANTKFQPWAEPKSELPLQNLDGNTIKITSPNPATGCLTNLTPDEREEVEEHWKQYQNLVRKMGTHLIFLNIVASKPMRNNAARIWCYDYAPSLKHDSMFMYAPRSVSGLENGMIKGALQRVIILEDLDIRTIGLVGTIFKIPPTVFEKHIQGSGYSDVSSRDSQSRLHLWKERSSLPPSESVSITWLRPVLLSISINEQARNDLLHGREPRMECIFSKCAKSRETHRLEAKVNILRGAVGLSTAHGDGLTDSFLVGWEERITVFRTVKVYENAVPCIILLFCVDPLPVLQYISELSQCEDETIQAESDRKPRYQEPTFPYPRCHGPFIPFRAVSGRGRGRFEGWEVRSIEQAARFSDKLQPPHSMLDRFFNIFSDHSTRNEQDASFPPLAPKIMMTLNSDILELIAVIDVSLDEIARLSISMTPTQLHEQALHWRSVLSRFQYELRRLPAQLKQYKDFMEMEHRNGPDDVLRRIESALERVDNAYASLRAEMSIMEARRSMEEAESVSKLTELAFIFIPLSFAASLFSMQVDVMHSSEGVPFKYFLITATSLIAFAYATRLIARSKLLLWFTSLCSKDIRQFSNLSEGDPITTRQFVVWCLRRALWDVAVFVIIGGLLATPLVFFWERKLDTGFSVVVSLILGIMDLALLVFVADPIRRGFKRRSGGEGRRGGATVVRRRAVDGVV
ncbi:hypothetical protein EG328_007233 [Venturia inaequalis]|uniref:Uncharacterized protein n=1 Tax=Venturia inaequalis TaxID=5025 RepID=A0A8H3VDG8_VENIN|nr:hypothetical protein EG328_007233 [Venturia inaequalis]